MDGQEEYDEIIQIGESAVAQGDKSPTTLTALLNAYFECLAGPILKHGGEVLKFMGDGLLAVFPLDGAGSGKAAANAALAAAEAALAALDHMNRNEPAPLNAFGGWKPLRTGIALHEGEVFFGNIGAPDRLDFTVIGPAVSRARSVAASSSPCRSMPPWRANSSRTVVRAGGAARPSPTGSRPAAVAAIRSNASQSSASDSRGAFARYHSTIVNSPR